MCLHSDQKKEEREILENEVSKGKKKKKKTFPGRGEKKKLKIPLRKGAATHWKGGTSIISCRESLHLSSERKRKTYMLKKREKVQFLWKEGNSRS